jgi:hypothetical protein
MEPTPNVQDENKPPSKAQSQSQSQKQRALTQLAKKGLLQTNPSSYHKSLSQLSSKGLGGRKRKTRRSKKRSTKRKHA